MKKLLIIGAALLVLVLPAVSLRLAGYALDGPRDASAGKAPAGTLSGAEAKAPRSAVSSMELDAYEDRVWTDMFGFERASAPAELSSRTGMPVALPTETLGRKLVAMLERPAEGEDPKGDIVLIYEGRMRLGTAYSPPTHPAVTAGDASSAGGELVEILGVPAVVREPAVRTDLATTDARQEPGVVVWVWRGKEWRLYGLEVPVADLTRVARSVISQQLKQG